MKKWEKEKEWRITIPTSRFLKEPTLEDLKLSKCEQLEKGIIEPWDKIANQQIALDNQDIKSYLFWGINCKHIGI